MFYSDIDLSKEVIKPKLQLCKSDLDRTIIANLTDAYQIEQKIEIGNLSELSFLLPFEKDVRNVLRHNQNAELIRDRYLIKFTKGNYVEYYIITKISNVMESDFDYKKIDCYSLGFELSYKQIKDYSVISYNASHVLNDVLAETIWTVDYIDSEFDLKYRSFDISGKVLDAIQQVAEAFDAIIEYDTVNRKVSLRKLDNIGTNKWLKVKYGNLLQSLTYESNTDEFCTRLKAFGKDGLSIQGVNPTGSNYIEDYSSIIYPFQRDGDGNVLAHSDYISDSLCNALLDYEALVQTKQGEFNGLLSQKKTKQLELTTQQNALTTLNNELAQIEDNISLANYNNQSTDTLVAQKNSKLTQISSQTSIVSGLQSQVNSINTQINTLTNLLKIENNFTADQLIEWNPHIIVQEWTNANYTDEKELYEAAIEEFNKRREPKIVVDISIVNFLEVLEEQRNWDKLNLGDIITIQHDKLNVNVEAKIISMSFNYENGDIKLTISNVRELLSDQDRFIRSLYRTISSSTSYNNNRFKIDDAYLKSSEIYQDIQGTWDAAKREIIASNNETVEISRKGLRIYDPNDPNKMLIGQHGILALSNDGGNTWKTAITPTHIVAERIQGALGEFVTLYADKIIVNPSNNAKIPDSVISSSTYWNTIESNSQEYVDTQVTELNNSLETLGNELDLYADDGQITLAEAQNLKLAQAQVNKESVDIIGIANSLGISTETTNYQNALSTLNSEIDIWTSKATYPTAISSTDRVNIKAKFENVQNTKSILNNKISALRQQLANSYTDTQSTAALNSAKAYSDTNLITANTYSNTINTALKNDLRLQAPLPTSIRMDGSGITASTEDPSKFARMDYRGLYVQNGAIQITSTDGTTIIDGSGVTASHIKAGDMFGVNLNIGSGNQIFKATSSGLQLGHAVFSSAPFRVDMSGNMVASNASVSGAINCTSLSINGSSILANSSQINGNFVNQIRTDQIVAGSARIGSALIDTITTNQIVIGTSGLSDSLISSSSNWNNASNYAYNSVQLNNIYNGVVINSSVGIQVTASNNLVRTTLNATNGISIQKNTFGSWNNVFYADTSGNLNIVGNITGASNINVTTNATVGDSITVGESIILSRNSGTGGIVWGTSPGAPQIYIDPASGALKLYTNGAGIYANGFRIDQPSVAVFG